ncbi:MAG: hypothetical protein M1831_002099 [Alyxoria varia]|nr:MAG: hypothetical protein M1831_002099 [Alyxoria varia]
MSARPSAQRIPSSAKRLPPALEDAQDNLEEDEESENDLGSEGNSLIGVSLGRAQTDIQRAADSENTDHAELGPVKSHGNERLDRVDEENQRPQEIWEDDLDVGSTPSKFTKETDHSSTKSSNDKILPQSDGEQAPKDDSQTSQLAVHDVPQSARPRASTDPQSPDDTLWRKVTSLPLPSLPKVSILPHRFSLSSLNGPTAWIRGSVASGSPVRSQSPAKSRSPKLVPRDKRVSRPEAPTNSSGLGSSRPSTSSALKRPAQPLRRSTSDGSLSVERALSRASSLGDDDRFEGVHEQVNSRFKAIKDSWADSNLRIPRFPELPNIDNIFDRSTQRNRASSLQKALLPRSASPRKPERESRSSEAYIHGPSEATPQGMTKTSAAAHPQFSKALNNLRGDVVVLGGYRGSVLRSADPPHRQCWVPIKVGLNIRKVNLEVGFDPADDERAAEAIIPDGMLTHIGPVDITRRLFKRLRSSKNAFDGTLRIWDFGYDWRLNPHLLSKRFIQLLETLPSNSPTTDADSRGATVIAHSLGGLLTRHAVNKRPELFRGILYAGVPQTCVNILGPLRNGDDVLLSSKVLTAQVNLSMRTSLALLPLDGKCFKNRHTKEDYSIDFFDPKTWEEHCLSPCVGRSHNPPTNNQSTLGALVGTVTGALPTIAAPGKEGMFGRKRGTSEPSSKMQTTARRVNEMHHEPRNQAFTPSMSKSTDPKLLGENPEMEASTSVSISKEEAIKYLHWVLPEIKRFKEELAFDPGMEAKGLYPPTALIYGKSVPTVYGAHVANPERIKGADAYDDLLFASGDGVVLARAAQLPDGYRVAKGGCISSDRGHISLLGDLEAVGQCLNAITLERKNRRDRNGS